MGCFKKKGGSSSGKTTSEPGEQTHTPEVQIEDIMGRQSDKDLQALL